MFKRGEEGMCGKCLVVERHRWETGFQEEQLQIPKKAFQDFFDRPGKIEIDVFASATSRSPTRSIRAQLSYYRSSDTYRINRVEELGGLTQVFIFIQEILDTDGKVQKYQLWWNFDVALTVAKFSGWNKAKDSQYGRGRLWCILNGPVPRKLKL